MDGEDTNMSNESLGEGDYMDTNAPNGGPVLLSGYKSGQISISEFQLSCSNLLDKWAAELDESNLQFCTVDISVEELIVLPVENSLASRIAELWPPKQDSCREGVHAVETSPNPNNSEELPPNSSNGRMDPHLHETEIRAEGFQTEDEAMDGAASCPDDIERLIRTMDQQFDLHDQMPEAATQGDEQPRESQDPALPSSAPQSDSGLPPVKPRRRMGRTTFNELEQRRRVRAADHFNKLQKMVAVLQGESDRYRDILATSKLHCASEARDRDEVEELKKKHRMLLPVRSEEGTGDQIQTSDFLPVPFKKKALQAVEPLPLDSNEVLLVIQLLDSFRKERKAQELIVRATQSLTELRDALFCPLEMIAEEAAISNPSAFFCIENIFYVDMRSPHATDCSVPHLQDNEAAREVWRAAQARRGKRAHARVSEPPPVYESRSMAAVRFQDLSLELGVQYLYQHQDGCVHSFLVTDVRMLHDCDARLSDAYPVVTFVQSMRRKVCEGCRCGVAKKVVFGDRMMGHSPAYLCEECHRLAHFKDGSLLYDDFLVKDYFFEWGR